MTNCFSEMWKYDTCWWDDNCEWKHSQLLQRFHNNWEKNQKMMLEEIDFPFRPERFKHFKSFKLKLEEWNDELFVASFCCYLNIFRILFFFSCVRSELRRGQSNKKNTWQIKSNFGRLACFNCQQNVIFRENIFNTEIKSH